MQDFLTGILGLVIVAVVIGVPSWFIARRALATYRQTPTYAVERKLQATVWRWLPIVALVLIALLFAVWLGPLWIIALSLIGILIVLTLIVFGATR